jgi:hypothetical protein
MIQDDSYGHALREIAFNHSYVGFDCNFLRLLYSPGHTARIIFKSAPPPDKPDNLPSSAADLRGINSLTAACPFRRFFM